MSSGTGFFTDITLCIGCKACEVACKQWNQLPAEALYGGYVLRKSVVHAGRDLRGRSPSLPPPPGVDCRIRAAGRTADASSAKALSKATV